MTAGCALAFAGVGVATARERPPHPATRIITRSPLDRTGHIRAALRVRDLGDGDCGVGMGSEVAAVAVRCGLYDPCWRAAPGATERVVCLTRPWARAASLVHARGFMKKTGITFGPLETGGRYPWGLELATGERCVALHGAHDRLPRSLGGLVVDYSCGAALHPSRVLLRNLRRGRVWHIGSARFAHGRYHRLGTMTIRRAIYVGLPPVQRRQHALATAAVAATGQAKNALRVRLAFPALRWASVEVLGRRDLDPEREIVLHRTGARWRVVRAPRGCTGTNPSRAVRLQIVPCR